MKLKKLGAVCQILTGGYPDRSENLKGKDGYLLLPSNLFENNIINIPSEPDEILMGPQFELQAGDILLKRLNPVFVNVFESKYNFPIYASNNIIILRTKSYTPYFLAAILEHDGITKLNHYAQSGTRIQTISVGQLSDLIIRIPDIKKQKIIGEIWQTNYKKKRLLMNLHTEQEKLINAAIKRMIRQEAK